MAVFLSSMGLKAITFPFAVILRSCLEEDKREEEKAIL